VRVDADAQEAGFAMRIILAAAMFVTAMFFDLRPAPARNIHHVVLRHARPWCIIENTGKASWFCYPSRALCRRFGEVPGTASSCVEYPVWAGR
jgi:hypothetical protein